MSNKLISIVIPTLNEEEGIASTIFSIPKKKLEEAGYKLQILVIDNNSSDKTVELARIAGAEVIQESIKGVGIATKTGFRLSAGEIVVTADGDGTYPLEILPELLSKFVDCNLDFITTDRFSLGCNGVMPLRNKIGNGVLSQTLRLLFGIPIQDSQSGMMIFKKSILERLQLKADIPLSQEMKIEACYFEKCKWMEVPIRYGKRLGESKLTNGLAGWKAGLGNLVHLFKKRIKR